MRKIIVLAIYCTFVGCSSETENSGQKCLNFIEKNKANIQKFNPLFEVSLRDVRLYKVYNEDIKDEEYSLIYINIHSLCDILKDDFIVLPMRIKDFKEQKDNFGNCRYFYKCKNNGVEDINFYKNYVDSFFEAYNSINLAESGYTTKKNIRFEGHIKDGRFIIFTINEHSNVYYLEDIRTLSKYWKEYFSHLKKVNENWFYEVK